MITPLGFNATKSIDNCIYMHCINGASSGGLLTLHKSVISALPDHSIHIILSFAFQKVTKKFQQITMYWVRTKVIDALKIIIASDP
jgi:hypothetical protein